MAELSDSEVSLSEDEFDQLLEGGGGGVPVAVFTASYGGGGPGLQPFKFGLTRWPGLKVVQVCFLAVVTLLVVLTAVCRSLLLMLWTS
jgi:hypothetical protein